MQLFLRRAAVSVDATPWSQLQGGEGYLCSIHGRPRESAKIYSDEPNDLEERLQYLVQTPPPTSLQNVVAWPLDIVEDGTGRVVGYLQTHFGPPYESLSTVISPLLRPPWATQSELRRTAHHVAFTIAELHAQGFLFPDLHADQFLVAPNRPTVLIDAASVQFSSGGHLFQTNMVRPEFQAPEFSGTANWSTVASLRDHHTDDWSLAVLLFSLAMGCHPFDGTHVGAGSALSREERIRDGQYPFHKSCRDYRPMTNAPPYRALQSELRDLFDQCFVDGHGNPALRPTAEIWADTLNQLPTLRTDMPRSPRPVATARPRWKTLRRDQIAALFLAAASLATPILIPTNSTPAPPPANAVHESIRPIGRPSSPAKVQQVINRIRGRK